MAFIYQIISLFHNLTPHFFHNFSITELPFIYTRQTSALFYKVISVPGRLIQLIVMISIVISVQHSLADIGTMFQIIISGIKNFLLFSFWHFKFVFIYQLLTKKKNSIFFFHFISIIAFQVLSFFTIL